MGTDLTFATGRFPQAIRFVLVNNRVPHMGQHCALCTGLIEKGYVRRKECVPYAELSSPARSAHRWTMRAYCRVDKCGFPANGLGTNIGPREHRGRLATRRRQHGSARNLELHWPAGLLLDYRRSIANPPACAHILDLEPNEVAAPQLAVNGQIEHRQVSRPPPNL